MKITALRLHNVKRFAGRGVALEGIGDGVNVLTEANEFGKSTCFEALHALFFQPHTGTPGEVQKLRPYSGGNPLVEVDIATADGNYRLTKQYYGGKRASVTDLATGRLIAQADEAEAFIARLIQGGTGGPAGLLWVRQGITGIEKRSKTEEEGDKRVRESLLSSVQGEVEALTGGRRMSDIVDACNEDLYSLVTPTMRPRANGLYDAALVEQKRLAADESRLGDEVKLLREALDGRRVAHKRLVEIEAPDEVSERRKAIATAEAAFESAKSHSAALKAAEAEAALARSQRDAARLKLSEYRAAIERTAQLRLLLAAEKLRHDEAVARRIAAVAEIDAAVVEVQAAETEERETRDLLARLDASMQAREAAIQLAEKRDRLEQAEAARRQVEEGEAELSRISVPAEALQQVQDLEIELVRLRAGQAATLPTFRMTYLDGSDGAILVDGSPLADGAEQGFARSVQLDIAGIGHLTLRSNRPDQADKALGAAEERHSRLLASLGVDSLAALRKRHKQALEKSAELDLARQRLGDLAPKGVGQLREDIALLSERSSGEREIKGDPAQLRLHLGACERRVAETRNAVREVEPLRGKADDAIMAARTDLAGLQSELTELEARLGPEDGRAERLAQLSAEHDEQQALFDKAEGCAVRLREAAHDLAAAEAALRRTRSIEEAADREADKLRVTLADLNGQIRTRSDDAVEEAWNEAGEALAAATTRVERFQAEIAVLDRLRKALLAARSAARDLYLKPVITELRPLLGLLFDDISIVFDENTLLPQTIRRNGQDEDVDRLSGGMREQLSVLTRLAFARLLARDGRPAPVILDDALVYSDDDRIERMFDALHRQSRDQQIIVFSCRQRAFSKLGGNTLALTEWQPDTH